MTEHNSKDVGLLDYLLILAKWRKLLFMNFVIVGVAATVLSFLLPKYYKATAVFLPPARSSGLTSLIQNFSVDLLGSSDITGEACLTILESRSLREEIIKKYDLMKLYKKDYIEHTLKELDSHVVIEPKFEVGIGTSTITSVTLGVIDKSPQRAAGMANDFLRLLEERIIALNTKKASNNRAFLESRLQQNKLDLQAAEDSLRAFQVAFGAVEISAQTKAAIEAAAKLKAEILALEVERSILEKSMLPGNSALSDVNIRLEAVQKEYNNLYAGNPERRDGQDVLIPISRIPSLGLRYFRTLREVEVQQTLYKTLLPLYEQARIQEAKTIPILKVIDTAEPPTYKYRPKRLLVILGILAVSTIFCLLYIFYREYLNNLKENDREQYRKFVVLSKIFSLRQNDKIMQQR